MKKIFIAFILTFLSFNTYAKEDLKFFGYSLGKTINPGKHLILLKSDYASKQLGQINNYFIKNMENISEEFHVYNLSTISLDKEFVAALNSEYKEPRINSEFILDIRAEGKELFKTYEKCEIKRKALFRNLKKKYESSGYRITYGRKYSGEILNEPREILEIYNSQDINDERYNQKDYFMSSFCNSNDGGGLLRPNGDRRERFDKGRSFFNFITQKDKSEVQSFITIQISSIYKKQILEELYKRYKSGLFTNFSLQGF